MSIVFYVLVLIVVVWSVVVSHHQLATGPGLNRSELTSKPNWGCMTGPDRFRSDSGTFVEVCDQFQFWLLKKEGKSQTESDFKTLNKCMVSAEPGNQGKDEPPQTCSISDCWWALKLWAAPQTNCYGTDSYYYLFFLLYFILSLDFI